MAALSSNQLFDLAREGFLQGTFTWDTDTWACFLNDDADDTAQSGDAFRTDFDAGGVGASEVDSATEAANQLPATTSTDNVGTADGTDVLMLAVTGDTAERVVLYREVGVDQTSRNDDEVVVYIHTVSAGLPITPNGGDITIQWDSGTNKIFTL